MRLPATSRPFLPALLVLFFSLLGGTRAAADDGKRPDVPPDMDTSKKTLTIGMSQEPNTLNPVFIEMSASIEVSGDGPRCGPIWSGLAIRGDDWKLMPFMAEEIPSIANGLWKVDAEKKTMTTTWHIRKEACWEDGMPITADDFLFTYHVLMDPNVPVVDNSQEKRIASMRAEGADHKTLVVEWKEPYAYADTGHWVLPRHVEEAIYQKDPAKYREATPANRSPLSNGPYRIKEWAGGSYIVLERNPKWWGAPARLDQIVFKFIPDTNSLDANLRAGALDAISPIGITFDQGLELEKKPVEGFQVVFTPGLVWEHVDFKCDSPILSDKRVRQALQYATDREKMITEYFEGRQEAAHSWLPPKHYGYNADVKKYPYDPKKAAQLLDDAGWKLGPDRIRVNGKGEPLTLTIMTTGGNKVRENIEQILQSQWKRVGVRLEIKNQDANVFFGETVRYRKFDHMVMYAWSMSPVSDGESLWTSKYIPSEANGWVGQNNAGFRNAETEKIDSTVPNTLDEAERARMLRREQEIWVEELPTLLLYFRTDPSVQRKTLRNWRPTGTDTGVSWNCADWYFAK